MERSRRGDVDPFIVMDVMEHARRLEAEGRHIIHMEVGQPGTPAPKLARAALSRALDHPLGYTVALGLPALRQGIARLYQHWYGIDLNPDRVIVTSGSSAAFILAFSALFDAKDRVGLPEPGYPSYRQILRAMSLTPIGLPTMAADRYQLRPGDLASQDLQGLILASPGNPTGTMAARGELAAIIQQTQAQSIRLLSDEIYHGLHYGEPAISALEMTDDVYVINSFSKYFSMTGWRIGWMVVPQTHIRTIERLAQNLFICPPHASQVAAIAALEAIPELEGNRDIYRENRRLMIAGLPKAGFPHFAPPDGAFYIYADVSDWLMDSLTLARDILEKVGVAVTPGIDFDPRRGASTLRFSYARSTDEIVQGLARLADYAERFK